MSCKAAKYTDEGWKCEITECRCAYLIPNSKACAEEYGEGPDSEESETE